MEVQQGEVLPEVFPAMVPSDPAIHTHMLVHHKCVLVVAKEQLLPLPLKPVFKLGLWGRAVYKKSRPISF